ncbi:MAG: WD40/YVTN/BNR-like repeat-containing protein [Saprospiraceae bacterium]
MHKHQLVFFCLLLLLACKKEKQNPVTGEGNCNDITENTAFPINIPGWKIEFLETGQFGYWSWQPYFLNETTGFIFEDNGHVLKTMDGGSSWKMVLENIHASPRSMFFVDDKIGFLSVQNLTGCPNNCDHRMTTFRTADGGETWQKSISDNAGIIWSLYFSDTLNGIGVALIPSENYRQRIIQTNNGGITWETLPLSGLNGLTIFQMQMLNGQEGFFAGDKGKLYRTKDGGVTFDSVQTPLLQFSHLKFFDNMVGLASDFYKTYSTSDGANTWQLVCDRGSTLIHWVDHSEILTVQTAHTCVDYDVLMSDAGFFVSPNRGQTWEQSNLSQNFGIYNYHFPLPNVGFGMHGSKLVKFTKQ